MGSIPREALKRLALGVAFRWLGLCYFYSSPACQQAPGANKHCCVMGGGGGEPGGGCGVRGFVWRSPGQVVVAASGQCTCWVGGEVGMDKRPTEHWMLPIPARVAAVKAREYFLKRADAVAYAEEC